MSQQEGSLPAFRVTSDPQILGTSRVELQCRSWPGFRGIGKPPRVGAAATANCRKEDGFLQASLGAGQSTDTWGGRSFLGQKPTRRTSLVRVWVPPGLCWPLWGPLEQSPASYGRPRGALSPGFPVLIN